MKNLFEYILSAVLFMFKRDIKISLPTRIDLNTILEGKNSIGRNVLLKKCSIGLATYICCGCDFNSTQIGRFCSIGQRVKTIHGKHPSSIFASTHPSFFSTNKQSGFTLVDSNHFQERCFVDKSFSVVIGNDVWIGSDVRILEGVKISDGAIIGTGALVTKDVPPYSIVVGIPAKIHSYRFKKEEIAKMMKIKWWNWEFSKIKEKKSEFRNIAKFIEQNEVE